MSELSYEMRLEINLRKAIETLEKERYYHFSWGLLEMLKVAKHNQRLLQSLLDQHSGTPGVVCDARLEEAHAQDTWY